MDAPVLLGNNDTPVVRVQAPIQHCLLEGHSNLNDQPLSSCHRKLGAGGQYNQLGVL